MSETEQVKTIAELLLELPAIIEEHDRRQREWVREHAKRMNAWFNSVNDIRLTDLPMRAQGVIWSLSNGNPIHPREADYLRDCIAEVRANV